MIHPRVGLTSSFDENNLYLGVYTNFLSIVGSNDQFATFFKSGDKNVFVYPECDLGWLIPMANSGNQVLKLELDLIVNNGDAQFISGTHDTLLPLLKIGFLSAL